MMNTASRLFAVGLLAAVPVIAGLIGKVFVCAAGDEVPTLVLLRAEAITSRMFATAGVAVEWRYKGSAAVSTDFVGALAYAQPYQDSKIVVMLDRVERSARQSSQVSNVLAHVMTHEITHLLQGVSRHSETGVMKAHWSAQDFELMAERPLPFAPEDIEMIQCGLARSAGNLVNSIATRP